MDTTKHVLVGYDGSAGAERSLSAAASLAHQLGAPLRVLLAQTPFAGELSALPEVQEQLHQAAESAATKVRAAHPDLDVTATVEWQTPRTALIDASRHAVVTVVGRRGHGPVKSLLLGSVSGSVAAHAHSPVLVVPDVEPPEDGRIVVGVDGSPESVHAAHFAVTLAGHDQVVLLHAWEPLHESVGALGPFGGYAVTDTEAEERSVRELLDEITQTVQDEHPGSDVVGRLVRDNPALALGTASRDARLVVVGARGRGGFVELLIGSVARSVLYTSECPVLVVPGARHEA